MQTNYLYHRTKKTIYVKSIYTRNYPHHSTKETIYIKSIYTTNYPHHSTYIIYITDNISIITELYLYSSQHPDEAEKHEAQHGQAQDQPQEHGSPHTQVVHALSAGEMFKLTHLCPSLRSLSSLRGLRGFKMNPSGGSFFKRI